MKKRIVSIFMALCLCLTLLPTAALAAIVELNSESKSGEGYTWNGSTLTLKAENLADYSFILPVGGTVTTDSGVTLAVVGMLQCKSGTVTINSSISLSELAIGSNAELKLTDNCTVTANVLKLNRGSTITISEGSTLEVCDSLELTNASAATDSTATITGGGTLKVVSNSTDYAAEIEAGVGGTLLLKNLTVEIDKITTSEEYSGTMALTLDNVKGSIGEITGDGTVTLTGGSEIKLTGNSTLSKPLTIIGKATLDLNGKTVPGGVVVKNGGNLTIKDTSEDKNGKVTDLTVEDGGALTLESGTIESLTVKSGATANLNGGTVNSRSVEDGATVNDGKEDEGDGETTSALPFAWLIPGGLVGTTDLTDTTFVDVSHGAYYYNAVEWAANRGIAGGVDSKHFAPDESCTRAQAVAMIYRAAGCPDVWGENPFVDVDVNDYYYEAVLWAVANGITSGTDATHFSPDEACTRGQIVTFLHRAARCYVAHSDYGFVDVKSGSYCEDAVNWAVENGITNGTSEGTFSPDAVCTRAQIVTFLYRNR